MSCKKTLHVCVQPTWKGFAFLWVISRAEPRNREELLERETDLTEALFQSQEARVGQVPQEAVCSPCGQVTKRAEGRLGTPGWKEITGRTRGSFRSVPNSGSYPFWFSRLPYALVDGKY